MRKMPFKGGQEQQKEALAKGGGSLQDIKDGSPSWPTF